MATEKEKKDYKDGLLAAMNPDASFDPENWEPQGQEAKELSFRKRVEPPKILPTFDIKPKEILEGQMIGMYESKQDLYLIFAWRCNQLQQEIDLLKEEITKLKVDKIE